MSSPSKGSLADRARRLAGRGRRLFDTHVWAVPIEQLQPWRRVLYRAGRILYSTATGYRGKQLAFNAAALTYYSVLSIVPFLAFAFSVVKGLGGYRRLVDDMLIPYLQRTFGENPTLLNAIDRVIGFVRRTDVAGLGTFGVLVLAYSGISLLATIEQVLNDIWGAKAKRTFLRQVTDYTTLMVIGPLLILVAVTLATTAQSSELIQVVRNTLSLGVLIDFGLKLSSLVLSCLAMIALFVIMPNTRVKAWSAVLGGITAALLWQGALVLHVRFQAGVARYNALYSGFAAIPIFLVWLYVSWLVLLVGALIGASHQNEKSVRQSFRAEKVDQDLREEIAVAIAGRIARGVLDGPSRVTAGSLADELGVPRPTVEQALAALTAASIAAPSCDDEEPAYLPAVDLDAATIDRVLVAIRRKSTAEEMRRTLRERTGPALASLLSRLDSEISACGHDVTLRRLGEMLSPPERKQGLPLIAAARWGGLAFFAVAGTQKALLHFLHPAMAALLGMLSGIGGGIVRDVLVTEIPAVLRADVYALAVLPGATVVAVAHALHISLRADDCG